MDALMDNLDPVDAALSRQFRPLVDRNLSIPFYDLTTVRIHGEAEVAADLRAFGMNKERGGIARQFVLGAVQTAEGLPLLHTVHPGNVAETKTLQGMLEKAIRNAELFDGKLVVLTNAPDSAPAEAIARYKALVDVERGFRVLKSDLEIAPVHHRLPERIRAHAMICFLASALYRVMRLRSHGHSASPRTALDLLARIQRHTAHIKRSFHGTSKTTPEQLDLFAALSLPKPN